MSAPGAHDPQTLQFYEREAETYAARRRVDELPSLGAFIALLPTGARVLELGCGGGDDAAALIARGFDVVATDGSAKLAAIAEMRLGRPVRVMRFDQLDARDAYDGVWANASLLHAPMAALPDVLTRVRLALKAGGVSFASHKAGDGEGRDALGRYYNFPTPGGLRGAYDAAGPWASVTMTEGRGGGYDGVERMWLLCQAVK